MSMLEIALAYAAKGIPVFPVGAGKEGKAPFTENGFHDATTDPEKVRAWWTKYQHAKIGMPCGRRSGIIVVDIDCHPGKPSGFEHVPNWSELSDHIVKTAGGGRHLYFADDGKTAIAHPFPGVEVRGDGHYVILPGPYGYKLESGSDLKDLKPVPEFLLKNARVSRGKPRLKRSREEPIPPSLLKLCEGHWGKGTSTDKDDLPDFELYVKAIDLIPNPDLPWDGWKRIIMAIWAAFLGSEDGLAAAHAFSRKSSKYDADGTDRAWDEVDRSPPSEISAGTLMYMADQASPGWRVNFSNNREQVEEIPQAESSREENSPDAKVEEPSTHQEKPKPGIARLEVVRLSDVSTKPIDWLWRGRIARGKLTIFGGHPGVGKSTLGYDIAARVSTGRAWPGGEDKAPMGSVIVLTTEDDPEDTIKPRVLAAGADPAKVFIIKGVRERDGSRSTFSLKGDVTLLEELVHKIGDVVLIEIDPVNAYMGQSSKNFDGYKDSDVRSVLEPLLDMAARTKVAVLIVTHFNKSGGQKAMTRFLGSIGMMGLCRAAYAVIEDEEDPGRCMFLPVKNNVGPRKTGLAYRIIAEKPTGDDVVPYCVGIDWQEEPVTTTADEALAQKQDGRRSEKLERAMEIIEEMIEGGPVHSKEVFKRCAAEEIGKKSVMNAHRKLREEGKVDYRQIGRDHYEWYRPEGPNDPM